jgi:hypothetical protein
MHGDLVNRVDCAGGCGQWLSRDMLERQLSWSDLEESEPDVLSLIGIPYPETGCPVCGRTMTVRVRMRVVFDHCNDHGVWLDRREREFFDRAFHLHSQLFPK